MKGTKEFNERMVSDKAFASKFEKLSNYDQALALAKAEGYDLELLSNEELDQVAGGSLSGVVATALVGVVKQGVADVKDIKNFINSDAYKAMGNEERNQKLGKELANSWGITGALFGSTLLVGGMGAISTQIQWRTSGTSDTVRNALESALS